MFTLYISGELKKRKIEFASSFLTDILHQPSKSFCPEGFFHNITVVLKEVAQQKRIVKYYSGVKLFISQMITRNLFH